MSDLEKFKEVIAVPYKDQAIFFLNAFWPEHQSQAEQVWKYVMKVPSSVLPPHEIGVLLIRRFRTFLGSL